MKNEEVKETKKTTKKASPKTSDTKKTSTVKKTSTTKKEVSKKVTPKKKTIKKEEKVVEEVIIEEVQKEEKVAEKKQIKTSDIILIIGLVLVIILGCFVMKSDNNEPTYELPLTITGDAGLHQLTYSEYKEKVDNDESFVLIIERATCSHCVSYMPVAENFAKDNSVPMYYVDTDTFSYEEWEKFEKTNTYLKKANGNWGTPTTIVLAGNQALDYIEGETSAESLKKLYNEYFDITLE